MRSDCWLPRQVHFCISSPRPSHCTLTALIWTQSILVLAPAFSAASVYPWIILFPILLSWLPIRLLFFGLDCSYKFRRAFLPLPIYNSTSVTLYPLILLIWSSFHYYYLTYVSYSLVVVVISSYNPVDSIGGAVVSVLFSAACPGPRRASGTCSVSSQWVYATWFIK